MPKAYNYDWQALLDAQKESGMNMKRFCETKNIPYSLSKNHKYALQRELCNHKGFVPVKTTISQEVRFNLNGNLLCFDSSLDDTTISRIVKAIIS